MEQILYLISGAAIGGIIVWLLAKSKFAEYKGTSIAQQQSAEQHAKVLQAEINELKAANKTLINEKSTLSNDFATAKADLQSAKTTIIEKNQSIESKALELTAMDRKWQANVNQLATAQADNNALNEKLQNQKDEMDALGKKFNLEFENIANKILETKTATFTELNKTNLTSILEPLGRNLTEFKTKVEEVYHKESQERFSLSERVKELAQLNQTISDEAKNLTKALKGDSKTQGNWGEMILESILERSGLEKGVQYFTQHELKDKDGNPLKSDSEDKKMRPDVVIKYPDNRSLIVDSKVSLNAFTRFVEATDIQDQKRELASHISAIKNHVNSLSDKGYYKLDSSLDFVLMFIPSESAYNAALQGDPDLWNFAYNKQIMLLSPANLIIAIKMLVDLWKREYQNQNALLIAKQGTTLYDKFVSFVDNLKDVGSYLDKAKDKYQSAYNQLSTGRGNLVSQAIKLRDLGIKPTKEFNQQIINSAENEQEAEE